MTTANTLSAAFQARDRKALETAQQELLKKKMTIDLFMTKFLDKFERKMNAERVDTPIWNLYHTKMKEYTRIESLIRYSQYYLGRM